jgi:hypothetical protein
MLSQGTIKLIESSCLSSLWAFSQFYEENKASSGENLFFMTESILLNCDMLLGG